MGKISRTREQLLDSAEQAILAKGFAATSIEELIENVGITKSGFFYHFKDKGTLAHALMSRYVEKDQELLDDTFARADELNDDPLHGLLIALKLLAEAMADLPEDKVGCLAAAFCYQDHLFDSEVRRLNAESALLWRRLFTKRLAAVSERYPPRVDVDMDALADMIVTVFEGGIIVSRLVREWSVLPKQILLYRDFVRSIFLPQ